MRILRTDSGGENFADERLTIMRKMLSYFDYKHLYMLHDHKGNLTVIWEREPDKFERKKVTEAWEFFCEYEIEHKLIEFVNI